MVYQRTERGLEPYTGELPEAVVRAIDRAEDDAIVAALTTGRYAEEYLYSFPLEGKEVVGISVPGAFEIARMLGHIEVLPEVKAEKDEEEYHVVVRVRDALRNLTVLGAARQPLNKQVKVRDSRGRGTGEYSEKPDPHAWSIAVNKAQRNGILHLTPNEARVRIVESFLAAGKGQDLALEGPGQQGGPQPGPGARRRITREEFVARCKERGYTRAEEVCAALGVANTAELQRRMTLLEALEKLPPKEGMGEPPELDF
jgi:prophage antirepressor-like protein